MLIAVPIALVLLSDTLPPRRNRVTNLVLAAVDAVISVGNAVGEAWTDLFLVAVGLELAVLAAIWRWAWAWPLVTPLRPGRSCGGAPQRRLPR